MNETQPAPTGKITPKVAAIIATASIAALLEIIDSSIVNVSIPTMMGNLGATLDEISWVTTGYMIANSIVLPIAAWLGSRLGRRRYFTTAILVFTLASFACGMAPNLLCLILFRVIQGFAGGALLPTSQTLIQEQFPREKAGMAMAIFGMSVMVGPALGPTLGGYLTDNFGWRSIFNVNVPIGILAAFLAWSNVENMAFKKNGDGKPQRGIDWTGLLLLCIGVGCFQYVLERGEADGWDARGIHLCEFFAVTGISTFIYWELKVINPIMNLRLFKYNILRSGTSLMLMLGIMLYAITFVVPIFASRVMSQMSATDTGMLFMPGSIVTAILMLPAGMMLKKVPPKAMVVIGSCLAELSVLLMTRFTTAAGPERYSLAPDRPRCRDAVSFRTDQSDGAGRIPWRRARASRRDAELLSPDRWLASASHRSIRFSPAISAQHYNDLIAHVNLLDPAAMLAMQQASAVQGSKLATEVGMGGSALSGREISLWSRDEPGLHPELSGSLLDHRFHRGPGIHPTLFDQAPEARRSGHGRALNHSIAAVQGPVLQAPVELSHSC